MKPTTKESIAEIENKFREIFKDIKTAFNKKYGIDQKEKPTNIQEAIEKKKNNQPFYKDDNKKPWE